ncbi:hypothetical protein [Herbiconiux sp. VKM Ac-2851]|uniref:hypothetical protein n=1 Tax=Herbiconiux sp. VKM Ac-2851 TaxID=2739025 RepID=UPI001566095D|nr:hypothetical protein [Herbiconiux sp. VKM Ac-2851]NQX35558.1 hypothetical protein [Herbiconiux sp. VKM Ac-2851]
MTGLSPKSRRDILIVVAVLVLAAGAFVAVFFALRTPPVPNAGELPDSPVSVPDATSAPSPVPTPVPSSSSPATGTPTAAPSASATEPTETVRFLDVDGSSIGVRATAGACGGAAPVVELSVDDGATWVPTALPVDDEVAQIVSLDVVSAEQVDLVVLAGEDCDPTVLTSYTAGQFWQDYPDRLGTASYASPASLSTVVVDGDRVGAPCGSALGAASADQGLVVRCADGAFLFQSLGVWQPVTTLGLSGLTFNQGDDASYLVGAQAGREGCSGATVSRFALDGSTFGGEVRGCAPVNGSATNVAVGADDEAVWVWDGTVVARSADGGATWITS